MCNLWLGQKEIEDTLKGRRIMLDSNSIASMVSNLNELLSTSERVQEDANVKADEVRNISDSLEESNSKLGEAVGALEELASTVEEVEGLLNDAEEHDLS